MVRSSQWLWNRFIAPEVGVGLIKEGFYFLGIFLFSPPIITSGVVGFFVFFSNGFPHIPMGSHSDEGLYWEVFVFFPLSQTVLDPIKLVVPEVEFGTSGEGLRPSRFLPSVHVLGYFFPQGFSSEVPLQGIESNLQ